MAAADRRHPAALDQRLAHEPYRFDFRQAVRLLELLQPNALPVGIGSDPRREAVRLRGSLRTRFPPSAIEAYAPAGVDKPPVLTATFLSLGGAFGPLPPPLNTSVFERERQQDHAARDFLDMFNHRLLSLFMRQWRLFHPSLQTGPATEQPAKLPLLALLGLANLPRDRPSAAALGSSRQSNEPLTGWLDGITKTVMGAAGLLNRRPVSAHALQRLLQAHFGYEVTVVTFRGAWLPLADDQRIHLGQVGQLGRNAVLGGRVWEQAAGITIRIGPIGLDAFLSLLPGGPGHAQLAGLIAFTVGDAFDVDLQLSLLATEVPPGSLKPPHGASLGRTTWLGRQPRDTPGRVHLRLTAQSPSAAHA